jgi:integrase
MASLHKTKNSKSGSTWRVSFYRDGKRDYLRLGAMSRRNAEDFVSNLKKLLDCLAAGTELTPALIEWSNKIDSKLRDRLTEKGLLAAQAGAKTLGEFLDEFIDRKRPVKKAATLIVYGNVRRNLVAYFGRDKSLVNINEGDADDWRQWLSTSEGLGEATIMRRSGIAKQFFRDAVKRRLLTANPFAEIESGSQVNDERDFDVTREMTEKVIAACPNAEWRLLFALSRFGGLRCPSEHLALRWRDIDWTAGKMTVTSPKTAHHKGGASRVVPIFPELLPYLKDCFDPEAEFVISGHRDSAVNLRTRLEKIIKRAGLEPWPKLWQNLRASRATELVAEHPAHVAAAWLGHSTLVAQKHYWMVTEKDFERATKPSPKSGTTSVPVETQTREKQAALAASPQATTTEGKGDENAEKCGVSVPHDATDCGVVLSVEMGGEGLEPPTLSV